MNHGQSAKLVELEGGRNNDKETGKREKESFKTLAR
jgi:hypothetical protein